MVVLDSLGCEFFWLWAQNPAWDPANAFHVAILRVHEGGKASEKIENKKLRTQLVLFVGIVTELNNK